MGTFGDFGTPNYSICTPLYAGIYVEKGTATKKGNGNYSIALY